MHDVTAAIIAGSHITDIALPLIPLAVYQVLSTVSPGPPPVPHSRYVVHRGFVNEQRSKETASGIETYDKNYLGSNSLILTTTDIRAPKAQEMAAAAKETGQARGEICWWQESSQVQVSRRENQGYVRLLTISTSFVTRPHSSVSTATTTCCPPPRTRSLRSSRASVSPHLTPTPLRPRPPSTGHKSARASTRSSHRTFSPRLPVPSLARPTRSSRTSPTGPVRRATRRTRTRAPGL